MLLSFAGCWLVNDLFADSVNDDPSVITKRTAEGINEILLVETTCANEGNKVPFEQAISVVNDNIKNVEKFSFMRKSANKGYYMVSRGEDPLLNETLFELLKQNYDIEIPDVMAICYAAGHFIINMSSVNPRLLALEVGYRHTKSDA